MLKQLNPGAVEVGIYLVALPEETEGRESELDEMWSYVGKKDNPRALVARQAIIKVEKCWLIFWSA